LHHIIRITYLNGTTLFSVLLKQMNLIMKKIAVYIVYNENKMANFNVSETRKTTF